MSGLFDKTTEALNSSADLRLLRNSVVSANIANAETPGYKAQKVDFEEALAAAIDREGTIRANVDHPDHFVVGGGQISKLQADVYDNPDINTTNDKNTVDLEREMANLAENTILYKAAVQMINKKLASLRYAVTEGGK
jgi:flagellar basal-body rod protein FlgB